MLAGTDNDNDYDYCVTQNGSNVQFDVCFNFSLADPYLKSIQCPVNQTTGLPVHRNRQRRQPEQRLCLA